MGHEPRPGDATGGGEISNSRSPLPGLGVIDVQPLEIPRVKDFSTGTRSSLGFALLGEPFHRADGPGGLDGLRLALFLELLRAPPIEFKDAPAVVDEHQAFGVKPALVFLPLGAPAGDVGAVLFAGV